MRIQLDPVEEAYLAIVAHKEALTCAEDAALLLLAYATRHMPTGWRPEPATEPATETPQRQQEPPGRGRNRPRTGQRDAEAAARKAAVAKVWVTMPHAPAAEIGRRAGVSERHTRRLLASMR